MKLVYNATTIEAIVNALNNIQVVGLKNAEILTFVMQELSKSTPIENTEESEAVNNGDTSN